MKNAETEKTATSAKLEEVSKEIGGGAR